MLVLAGALYTRLTAIKLPGGGEIDLSEEERNQVTQKVAEAANASGAEPSPAAVSQSTVSVLALASGMKAATGSVSLDALGPAAHLALASAAAAPDEGPRTVPAVAVDSGGAKSG